MRCDKERLLKDLDEVSKTGSPKLRPAGAMRDMVDLDDLVIVPSETVLPPERPVATGLSIGLSKQTKHPIGLDIPFYISDMSFGELGRTAKIALLYGATTARTMVMAGHGGLLHEEREISDELDGTIVAKWSRGRHGVNIEHLSFCDGVCIDLASGPGLLVQASASTKEVAESYGVPKGGAISQPRSHLDLRTEDDIKAHIELLREALQYEVPVLVKFSGGSVYEKVRGAIEAGADAVVLEGIHAWRAMNTHVQAEHAGEPLLGMIPPALRAMIDTKAKSRGFKLLVQGGILNGADAFKALALGADGVGLDCAALVAIGCRMAGVCHTGKCPQGVATVDPKLEAKINFKQAGESLAKMMRAFTEEMRVLAGFAGLTELSAASMNNLRALTYDAAAITGAKLLGFDRSLPLWIQ